ncbi:MAG: hypothetical protein GY715_15700 [Planctomycetes bacterium]|nr:hypothetical protein [Planctomycetota bacterium]
MRSSSKSNPLRTHRFTAVRRSLAALIVLGVLFGTAAIAVGMQRATPGNGDNRRCMSCHGDPRIAEYGPEDRRTMVKASPAGVVPGEPAPANRPDLYLDPEMLANSLIHGQLRCVDCHRDSAALPHASILEPASCGTCHVEPLAAFERGAHAAALARKDPNAPTCGSCHGTHQILPPHERDALTHPLNVVRVCSECHEHHAGQTPTGHDPAVFIQSYLDSVHGKAVSQAGLLVAATCADCHGRHDVRAADDPVSMVHRDQIPATCGTCHLGVVETYRTSIHGQRLEEGDERAPVCTDCHTAHHISRAQTPGFMVDIVNECGDCHDQPEMHEGRRVSLYRSYRASYHGQVNKLGHARAARCSDCHGAHDILPISDEHSRLFGEARVETCRQCHEGAPASLADFDPHADYLDRDRYPLLNAVWWYFAIVISSAMGFFGLHSILWFIRSLIERVRHGIPAHAQRPAVPAIRRFTLLNRINHALLIIPFFGLTLTGLPLLLSDHAWSQAMARFLGGGSAMGILHRIFAIMLIANFALHLGGLIMKARQHEGSLLRDWLIGPNSMLPRWRDVRDCAAMFRWFFFGGKHPTFDRWTYWEKFDYLAEIGGTFIIGGSGLMLWFPGLFALVLPGWAFNVASIVHGYEALLAVSFIFTIHFFNAHLRPDKFPVDDVIFSGSLSEAELRHERRDEYDRLAESGQLASMRVPATTPLQRKLAVTVGIIAMLIGFSMVALIIAAGLQQL